MVGRENGTKIIEKYNHMPVPAKAAIWFTICNLLLKGISFISTPIFTRILPEEEYGLLSIFISYEQLFLIFATWEIQMGAYQKGLFNYKDDVKLFASSTQCLANIITVIVFGLILLFRNAVSKWTGMSTSILILLCLYLLVQPAYNCWLIRKRTSYEYRPAVAVTLLYSIANVIVPMAALFLTERTANVKFGFTMAASIGICLFFFLPHANYTKLIHNWSKVKAQWLFLIRFQGPLVLHSLSYLILNQADRVMIGNMVGNTQAGFYSIAYNLANVVSILQNSINQSLTPWRYEMMEAKRYGEIRKTTNYLLCAVGAFILVFVMVAPEIMRLLFTESYYEAVWCIPPVSASVYFMFLYTIFVNVETFFEKTKFIMYVSVACGVLNIVLNYLCLGHFGYIACGYTTLFSYIMFAIGHYFFMNKVRKQEIPGVRIFNVKLIVMISLAVILLEIGITLLYPYPSVRYGIVVIVLLFAFSFRKRLFKFIGQWKGKKKG